MTTHLPDENWTLERLGKFCSQSQKKMAVDAWRFGHALNLARDKQSHGDWQKWKKQYVPYLSNGSEYRLRKLAEMFTEEELDGVGLTEAYRLLGLAAPKGGGKDHDGPFGGAPVTVLAGSGDLPPDDPVAVAAGADDPDEEGPDDTDDLAVLPQPDAFPHLAPATGLLGDDPEQEPPPMPIGPLEVEAEPEDENPPPVTGPLEDGSPEERYRLLLVNARQQMEGLRSWRTG